MLAMIYLELVENQHAPLLHVVAILFENVEFFELKGGSLAEDELVLCAIG